MIDFLSNNWWIIILLYPAFKAICWLLQEFTRMTFRDVIAKSKKDPKCKYWLEGRSKERDFTDAQRLIIYQRDKGICQVSGKKTKNTPKSFSQNIVYGLSHIPGLGLLWLNDLAEIDHIIYNSYRGPAELWNGRVTRKIINRKRSNKPDRDFFNKLRERGEKVYLKK